MILVGIVFLSNLCKPIYYIHTLLSILGCDLTNRTEEEMMPRKIIILTVTAICLLMFTEGCMFKLFYTKKDIIQFVLDNEELLNEAVVEIYNLDEYVRVVANTRFWASEEIEGYNVWYTWGILDSKHVEEPLDNPILNKLLRARIITRIEINRAGTPHDGTDQLKFWCRGRGIWDRYEGFYYSINDELVTFDGTIMNDPMPEGEGWVAPGTSYNYVEKITDHWYYYLYIYKN